MRKGNQKFSRCYDSIKARCERETAPNYYLYGGRGIKMMWKSFKDFKNDMYKSFVKHIEEYGDKNTSIDRINNDGNYYKENCKWSTNSEQARNRRSNRLIEYKDKIQTIADWSDETGLPYQVIKDRLNRYKWSIKKTLETPILNPHKQKTFFFKGKSITASELAKKLGITRPAIFCRLKAGWTEEEILNTKRRINQYK